MTDPAVDTIRHALARYLDVPVEAIEPDHVLAQHLSLEPLDVVLIALGLEDFREGEFPIGELGAVTTVRELARLYEAWAMDGTQGDVDEDYEDEPAQYVARIGRLRSRPLRGEGPRSRRMRRGRRWNRIVVGQDAFRR